MDTDRDTFNQLVNPFIQQMRQKQHVLGHNIIRGNAEYMLGIKKEAIPLLFPDALA